MEHGGRGGVRRTKSLGVFGFLWKVDLGGSVDRVGWERKPQVSDDSGFFAPRNWQHQVAVEVGRLEEGGFSSLTFSAAPMSSGFWTLTPTHPHTCSFPVVGGGAGTEPRGWGRGQDVRRERAAWLSFAFWEGQRLDEMYRLHSNSCFILKHYNLTRHEIKHFGCNCSHMLVYSFLFSVRVEISSWKPFLWDSHF